MSAPLFELLLGSVWSHAYSIPYILLVMRKSVVSGGLTLGRETQKSLKKIKKLGDLSAHSRRYNAIPEDLDKVNLDVRLAVEELINIARLK